MTQDLDTIKIHFDGDGLLILNIALAVVMFGVALDIKLEDFKKLLATPKLLFLGILSQFVLLPFVTYILVLILQPRASIALGMMMVAACPGGNISNFMTHLAKGNTALSVSLTSVATLLAIVMTPLNFQLYGNFYAPTAEILQTVKLNPCELIKLVLLLLGLPLLVGMTFRIYKPLIASKISKILKPISIIIFIAIVIIAFNNNLDIFNEYIHYVWWIGLLHNAISIGLGFLVATIFSLSFTNKKTLAIETGIQNSGLGLLLIFTFFDGLGGMAIITAFWGIWHIISGLTVATIWSKMK